MRCKSLCEIPPCANRQLKALAASTGAQALGPGRDFTPSMYQCQDRAGCPCQEAAYLCLSDSTAQQGGSRKCCDGGDGDGTRLSRLVLLFCCQVLGVPEPKGLVGNREKGTTAWLCQSLGSSQTPDRQSQHKSSHMNTYNSGVASLHHLCVNSPGMAF